MFAAERGGVQSARANKYAHTLHVVNYIYCIFNQTTRRRPTIGGANSLLRAVLKVVCNDNIQSEVSEVNLELFSTLILVRTMFTISMRTHTYVKENDSKASPACCMFWPYVLRLDAHALICVLGLDLV